VSVTSPTTMCPEPPHVEQETLSFLLFPVHAGHRTQTSFGCTRCTFFRTFSPPCAMIEEPSKTPRAVAHDLSANCFPHDLFTKAICNGLRAHDVNSTACNALSKFQATSNCMHWTFGTCLFAVLYSASAPRTSHFHRSPLHATPLRCWTTNAHA